jgi:hypothetical protein
MRIKKWIGIAVLLIGLLPGVGWAASNIYGFTSLTGGISGSLDNISGTNLADKDMAFGIVNGQFYSYSLNATSGATENSPFIIAPNSGGGNKRWVGGPSSYEIDILTAHLLLAYTKTPASTSTITMLADLTNYVKPGDPLRYTIGGVDYYGVVSAITSNLLTVSGPPLTGSVDLFFLPKSKLSMVVISVPGLYEATASSAIIQAYNHTKFVWNKSAAYLVKFFVRAETADTGDDGIINAMVGGSEVDATGLTIAADDTLYSTGIGISAANYSVNYGDVIELKATPGSSADSEHLTATLIFVIP